MSASDHGPGSAPIRCPECALLMRQVEIRGAQIDVCPSCRGTWFDRGELQLFLGRTLEPKPNADLPRSSLACPRCATIMFVAAIARPDADLDACAEHGLFARGTTLDRLRSAGGLAAGAAGLAATGLLIQNDRQSRTVEIAGDVLEGGLEVAGEALGDASLEVGGEALEVVGEIAGAALELIGDLLSGL